MEQRVSLITLGVADIARATAFYERLGWKASTASVPGEVTFFRAGGMAVGLWGRSNLASDTRQEDTGATFSGVALAYNTRSREEVDAVLAEAVAAGGRVLRPTEVPPWGGATGYFADLDGHAWEVAWNPSFPIAEDGTIRIP